MKHFGLLFYSLFMATITTALVISLFFAPIYWSLEKIMVCGTIIVLGYFGSSIGFWFYIDSKKDVKYRDYRNKILRMLEEEDFMDFK
jgi:hypothetical protein